MSEQGRRVMKGGLSPVGGIGCYQCLYPEKTPTDKAYGFTDDLEFALSRCEKCGREILTHPGLAMEMKLADKLRAEGVEVSIWQTGGMNSAVGYHVNDTDVMATAEDSVDSNAYRVSMYVYKGDEYQESESVDKRNLTFEEAVDTFKQLVGKAIKRSRQNIGHEE